MSVRSLVAAILLAVGAAVHVTVLSGDKGALLAAEPELRLEYLSAEHVADIYARVAKGVPLSAESDVALPVRDVFAANNGAVMVEIIDRVGPFAQANGVVFRADGESDVMFTARRALSVLSDNNIAVESAQIAQGDAAEELQLLTAAGSNKDLQFVKLNHLQAVREMYGVDSKEYNQHSRALYKQIVELSKVKPVIVVEQAAFESAGASRRLTSVSASNSTVPPTVEEIADYQITLWTAVGLFGCFFAVSYLVGAMDIEPDSLLYAKFQSVRAQHRHD